MQMTRVIERSFHLESAEERDGWVAAYELVKKDLDGTRASVSDSDNRMRAMSFIEKGKPKVCTFFLFEKKKKKKKDGGDEATVCSSSSSSLSLQFVRNVAL